MDIKLLRAVIEKFGTYEEYVSFLHKSSDCDKCEYFRDCENQCGRNIYEEVTRCVERKQESKSHKKNIIS